MKLRNKRTGKVFEWFNNTDGVFPNTLAELNEKWEDYEEPKEYWYMDYGGRVKAMNDADDDEDVARKKIGNYFETKEEAVKAVEKLKALKRLKDKGYYFGGWKIDKIQSLFVIKLRVKEFDYVTKKVRQDLDLLFGGNDE